MSKLQNDILHLSLSLLEMETQLIVYNSRIRLNWVQNCQNPKSHTSGAFLEIFIKPNLMASKSSKILFNKIFCQTTLSACGSRNVILL